MITITYFPWRRRRSLFSSTQSRLFFNDLPRTCLTRSLWHTVKTNSTERSKQHTVMSQQYLSKHHWPTNMRNIKIHNGVNLKAVVTAAMATRYHPTGWNDIGPTAGNVQNCGTVLLFSNMMVGSEPKTPISYLTLIVTIALSFLVLETYVSYIQTDEQTMHINTGSGRPADKHAMKNKCQTAVSGIRWWDTHDSKQIAVYLTTVCTVRCDDVSLLRPCGSCCTAPPANKHRNILQTCQCCTSTSF